MNFVHKKTFLLTKMSKNKLYNIIVWPDPGKVKKILIFGWDSVIIDIKVIYWEKKNRLDCPII